MSVSGEKIATFASSKIIYFEAISENEKVKRERKKMIILKSCFLGFLIACLLFVILVFFFIITLGG